MAIIEIEDLWKSYRIYQKKEGLLASVIGLFKRQYRDVTIYPPGEEVPIVIDGREVGRLEVAKLLPPHP